MFRVCYVRLCVVVVVMVVVFSFVCVICVLMILYCVLICFEQVIVVMFVEVCFGLIWIVIMFLVLLLVVNCFGEVLMFLCVFLLIFLLLCVLFVYVQDVFELVVMFLLWSGSGGEFGFVLVCGNSSIESFNGCLCLCYIDGDWVYSMDLFGLCFSFKVIEINDDGIIICCSNIIVNCYIGSVGSVLQLGEYCQLIVMVCIECDDFVIYDCQSLFGLGYGICLWNIECFLFDVQIGFGVCCIYSIEDDCICIGMIGCGLFDLKYLLIDNIDLVNMLLVEFGLYNIFGQNDFGVLVSMNEYLVLKVGWQVCYNSDVVVDKCKIDMLIMMNVVYKFK